MSHSSVVPPTASTHQSQHPLTSTHTHTHPESNIGGHQEPSQFVILHRLGASVSRPLTRSQNNISEPNKFYGFVAAPSAINTPVSFRRAQESAHGRDTVQTEYNALLKNKTWVLLPPNAAYNVVDCRWIFEINHNSDGSVECYKAHLVTKGFTQRPGIDYTETFSPVIKATTI